MDNIILVLSGLFNWILMTSLMATVLVALIFLVKFILKDNLKVRWQYIIWFILILRLLLPWTPESSISMFNLFTFMNRQNVTSGVSNNIIFNNEPASSLVAAGEKIQTPAAEPPSTKSDTVDVTNTKDTSFIYTCFLLAWLLGVFALTSYLILTNRRLARKIDKSSDVITNNILSVFEQSKSEMRVKRNIPVMSCNGVESPTLYGFLRSIILLPAKGLEEFSLNELRYIFLHELVHYKRKDIVVNWLMTVVLILHWFNPVLWYAYKRMREDQELSCDAIAVSHICPDEVKEYGNTIIKLLKYYSQSSWAPSVANFSADKSQLKRRITMITLFKKHSYKWSILGLGVILLLGGLALTNAKAAPQKENAGEQQKEIVVPTPAKPTSDSYVVLNDYYYVPNGDTVNESQLGEQNAQVKRNGDWQFKQTGDTNFFAPPAPIYSIQGIKVDERVAVKAVTGGTKQNPVYTFLVLERSKAVETPNGNMILGAKNDPKEVSIALKNIKEIAPYLYEFQTKQIGVTLTSASYSQDAGVALYYRVPEADDKDTQGFLFVFEYPIDMLDKISNSAFSAKLKSEQVVIDGKKVVRHVADTNNKTPTASKTFDLNGIHWSYYGDRLLRGEKGDNYYEIQAQGKFTYDRLIELLKNFYQNKN
jgi:beta-lactamase regulating signal transducer with metallopeptidase domain